MLPEQIMTAETADTETKETILFCPGPEYLFLTTGIYYVWELSLSYKVVLLLSHRFENTALLEELKERAIIYDYLDFFGDEESGHYLGLYHRHRYWRDKSRAIFEEYRPVAIFQCYLFPPDSLYLFEEALSRSCRRISVKPSLVLSTFSDMHYGMFEIHINRKRSELHIPYSLAKAYVLTKGALSFAANYYVLPAMMQGRRLYVRFGAVVRRGSTLKGKDRYIEYSLTHSEEERRILMEDNESSILIRHPLSTVGETVNALVYGETHEEKRILILPTDGEIDYIRRAKGVSDKEAIMYYASVWSQAIRIIQVKFPEYEIYIKPKHGQHVLDKAGTDMIMEQNSGIVPIPTREGAQREMLRSRVIVSGRSTVVWWAAFLPQRKTIISLDLFGEPGGDIYKRFKRICYFNSLEGLSGADFSDGSGDRDGPAGIGLTDFVRANIQGF